MQELVEIMGKLTDQILADQIDVTEPFVPGPTPKHFSEIDKKIMKFLTQAENKNVKKRG